jgi:hypothetical protein
MEGENVKTYIAKYYDQKNSGGVLATQKLLERFAGTVTHAYVTTMVASACFGKKEVPGVRSGNEVSR